MKVRCKKSIILSNSSSRAFNLINGCLILRRNKRPLGLRIKNMTYMLLSIILEMSMEVTFDKLDFFLVFYAKKLFTAPALILNFIPS